MSSIRLQAITEFHTVALAALQANGRPATKAEVARVIGESPQAYSDALAGRSGSLDRLHSWIVAFEKAKIASFALILTSETASLQQVGPPK